MLDQRRRRTVVLLGDSISVGTFPFLKQRLQQGQSQSQTSALLVAKVGAPTAWMRSMLPTVIAAGPTDVLVMGGTNDIAGGSGGSGDSSAMTRAIANLMAIQSALEAPEVGARVLVSTIPPRTDEPGRARTARYNDLLVDALTGAGAVVDVGSGLSPALIGGDHVHPTVAGYQELARRWSDAVDALDEEPSIFWGLLPLAVGYVAARTVKGLW